MEVGTIVKEYKNGALREFITENGEKFQAYVPYECNNKTPIMIYEHGDNGYTSNWKVFEADLMENECNSIIIRGDRKNKIKDYNYLVNQYNLESPQPITVSFSGGTPSAMNETSMMIKETEGQIPGIAVILDGYAPTAHLNSKGVLNDFKSSNSIVLAFSQKAGIRNYVNEYENLAKNGVNTLILYDQSSHGQSHGGVNNSFVQKNILEYILGTGKLPNNYIIKKYDAESQSFVNVDINEVSTINDVYKYFGIDPSTISNLENGTINFGLNSFKNLLQLEDVKSDNEVLSSYLNNIRGVIRSTSFLQGASLSSGFASDTKVPSALPGIVSQYITSTGALLQTIANDTSEFSKIGQSIETLDQEMTQESNNLSDILTGVGTGAVVGNTLANQTTGTTDTTTKNTSVTPSTNSTTTNPNTNNQQTTTSNQQSNNSTNNQTSNNSSSNTNTNTSNNSSSNNSNNNHSNNNSNSSNKNNNSNNNQPSKKEPEKSGIETFHDYDKLVSDDTKIVYNCNEEYKIVIHKDGDKITGIEHYFDFGTEESAKNAISTLEQQYKTTENFDKIIQNDRYIKVLFNENEFKNLTISDIKSKYSTLSQI